MSTLAFDMLDPLFLQDLVVEAAAAPLKPLLALTTFAPAVAGAVDSQLESLNESLIESLLQSLLQSCA
jgi:hypothetical protein